MTYDGFGSPDWARRLKGASTFRIITSPSDARPPVPLDPYGTDPGAWTRHLNGLLVEYLRTGTNPISGAAHILSCQMLQAGLQAYSGMLVEKTFDEGPRTAREYAAQVMAGFIEEGSINLPLSMGKRTRAVEEGAD